VNWEMYLKDAIELNSDMHLETMIERVWSCICRLRSSNSEMPLEANVKLNLQMHFKAVME